MILCTLITQNHVSVKFNSWVSDLLGWMIKTTAFKEIYEQKIKRSELTNQAQFIYLLLGESNIAESDSYSLGRYLIL
jgi:hypothetical protein